MSEQDRLLRELLKIEKHEDRMMTVMVKLMLSNEKLSRRFGVLTWVMMILTWVTFVVSIPNTLATIFGIPRISQVLELELMVTILIISTFGALLILLLPRSPFSLSNLEKMLSDRVENE